MKLRIQNFFFDFFEELQSVFQNRLSIFILHPHNWGIGNTTEEIMMGLLQAKHSGKKIVFIRRFVIGGLPTICNREIFRLHSKYILGGWRAFLIKIFFNGMLSIANGHVAALFSFIVGNAVHILSQLKRDLFRRPNYIPYKHFFLYRSIGVRRIWIPVDQRGRLVKKFSWPLAENMDWSNRVENLVPLQISPEKEVKMRAFTRQMGLTDSDWFVCLHVREGGFKGDFGDIRNCDIQNYLPAVKKITDSGGWVVRMGDPSMTPLPKMERVIDYPFTKFKSELMDVFLIKNCRFFFGQNSGIVSLAILLDKKCALVNMTEWITCSPKTKNSLMIFRHYFSEELGRYLSIREVLSQPFECQDLGFLKYRLKQNSAAEISDLIEEILSQDEHYKFNDKQLEFLELRKNQIKGWVDNLRYPNPEDDVFMKFRIASHIGGVQSTLGRRFIESYWDRPTQSGQGI